MLNLSISIKTKISAVITLSVVFVVIVMCGITVIYQLNHMKEFENKILKDSVGGAATVAYTIMPYFVEKDFTAMNNLISYFSKRSDRAYLLVVDNNNRIMAHSSHAKIGSTFENPAAYETEKINEGINPEIRPGRERIHRNLISDKGRRSCPWDCNIGPEYGLDAERKKYYKKDNLYVLRRVSCDNFGWHHAGVCNS